jgi:iron complex outermembrane receptor protein
MPLFTVTRRNQLHRNHQRLPVHPSQGARHGCRSVVDGLAALSLLLAATNATAQAQSAAAPAGAASAAAAAPSAAAAAAVVPASVPATSLELQRVIVIGDAFSRSNGFLAQQSSTGTRFPVDTEKLPNTIRVLPQQLFEATNATLPQEVTKYVSGVQPLPSFGTGVGYVVRGFFANYETLQNGVRSSDNPGDLSNVERIEVLKGPIGSLYGGTGAFAGNVNVITKRPLKRFAGQARFQLGSDSFYRADVDVGGPLVEDGSLRYRLTGAVEDAGSFRDNARSDKRIVSPSLEMQVSDRATLRLDASLMNRRYTFDEGQLAVPATFNTPLSRTYFPSNRSQTREDYGTLGLEGDIKLTEQLSWRVAALITDYDIRIGSSRLSTTLQADGRTLERFTYEGPQRNKRQTLQSDLIYRTDAIGEETVLLLGYERFKNNYTYDVSGRALPTLDLFGTDNPPVPAGPLTPQFAGFSDYVGNALYAQMFTQFTDQLSVLVGVRYDTQTNSGKFNGSGSTVKDKQPSPRVGLSYRVAQDTTVFGNWATSFSPNFALDRNGDVFRADKVRQIELGLRQSLAQDRAQLTMAVFDIRRSNVVIPDINNFAQSVAGGQQSSRGLEIDITGRLSKQFELIANYAYTRARVTGPNDPNSGQTLAAVPRQSVSLFGLYKLIGGAQGLALSAGLVHNTPIQATLPNSVVIGTSTRLDLGASYDWQSWRAGVNLLNASNEKGYVSNFYSLFPQAPRQLMLSLSYKL